VGDYKFNAIIVNTKWRTTWIEVYQSTIVLN
jgi:hypothetical protein